MRSLNIHHLTGCPSRAGDWRETQRQDIFIGLHFGEKDYTCDILRVRSRLSDEDAKNIMTQTKITAGVTQRSEACTGSGLNIIRQFVWGLQCIVDSRWCKMWRAKRGIKSSGSKCENQYIKILLCEDRRGKVIWEKYTLLSEIIILLHRGTTIRRIASFTRREATSQQVLNVSQHQTPKSQTSMLLISAGNNKREAGTEFCCSWQSSRTATR